MATKKKKKASTQRDPEAPVVDSKASKPHDPPAEAPKTEQAKVTEENEASTRLDRETIIDAVYLEALERGMTERVAIATAEDVADRLRLGCTVAAQSEPMRKLFDLRAEQDFVYPNGKRKTKMVHNEPVIRKIEDVDTITLHQTAVEFGVSRRAILKSGGDETLALARRALDVACHFMSFRGGFNVYAHDILVYVNHGNRWNGRGVGLEIDGRYPGLLDDPSTMAREDLRTTWGGEPTELTDVTVETACEALEAIAKETRDRGGRMRYIVSHRQSSDMRRSDPGQEIWERVAIDHGEKRMGLELRLDSPWTGNGRPVPVQWDPRGKGKY